MHRSKEIMLLFALLVVGAVLVLWYTFDRRAKNRAAPPQATAHPAEPASSPGPLVAPAKPGTAPSPIANPAEPVDLTKHERKTIDFTSGKPVVKDSPEDKAAIDAALKDIAAATKDVTFEAPKKNAESAPAPPKS